MLIVRNSDSELRPKEDDLMNLQQRSRAQSQGHCSLGTCTSDSAIAVK